jgi:hypothetical protein
MVTSSTSAAETGSRVAGHDSRRLHGYQIRVAMFKAICAYFGRVAEIFRCQVRVVAVGKELGAAEGAVGGYGEGPDRKLGVSGSRVPASGRLGRRGRP